VGTKSERRTDNLEFHISVAHTDNKISYQCSTLIRNSIVSVAHTDNRFYEYHVKASVCTSGCREWWSGRI